MTGAQALGRYRPSGGSTVHTKRRSLLLLNALGGAAVLVSYAWGLGSSAELGASLWGGVPEGVWGFYTLNMFLAAAGYFLFTPYILFRLPPDTLRIAGRFGFGLFHVLYALVLLPSALWLPLTAHMIAHPSAVAWLVVRLDLALAALGSLGLLASLMALPSDAPRGRALAVIGLIPFCLQTVVLDALIWAALFPAVAH
jgi:hypothetical protein